MVGVGLCWVSGVDCLLLIMTICLQSEQGNEMERDITLHNTLYSRQDDGGWPNCGMESSGCSINIGYGWGSCHGCTADRQSSTPAWSLLKASLYSVYTI